MGRTGVGVGEAGLKEKNGKLTQLYWGNYSHSNERNEKSNQLYVIQIVLFVLKFFKVAEE